MRNDRYIIYMKAALFAVLAFITSGCVERDLLERELPSEGLLRVNFSWPEESDVPGARLWLCAPDGMPLADELCDAVNHEFIIMQGIYSLRTVNTGLINADCIGPDMVRARTDNGKGILMNVGKVYCTGADNISVKADNGTTEVTLHPKNAVRTIRFELDTEGVGPFEAMELRLSGIVPSVRISDGGDAGEPTGDASATVKAEGRAVSATSHTAEMSVFGWRGENVLTATVHRADGSVETSVPQEIGDLLDKFSESGVPIHITLRMPDGGEIGLSVTVSAWQIGTGSGTVG
ncbi:FimB/Mfa2 family fimbrial subunit [Parabacteroides distasonis]|uniref:FimB/Mfa2 family fimbrial subunit n=1 Tax=Parabacteroides distasonis TaxID=823 RepID=UPI0021646694|nr:FimB/Mfa2 family fimbrial subunit [Parabacteroides distasonis]UVR25560.1 FimB/Mfa2 family fimbrial subunit [Parabacteroides distasonis]